MTLFAALAFSKDGMMAASFVMLGTSLLLLLVGNAGRPGWQSEARCSLSMHC